MASLLLLYRVFPERFLRPASSPTERVVSGVVQFGLEATVMHIETLVIWAPLTVRAVNWAFSPRRDSTWEAAYASAMAGTMFGALVVGGLLYAAPFVALARVGLRFRRSNLKFLKYIH